MTKRSNPTRDDEDFERAKRKLDELLLMNSKDFERRANETLDMSKLRIRARRR